MKKFWSQIERKICIVLLPNSHETQTNKKTYLILRLIDRNVSRVSVIIDIPFKHTFESHCVRGSTRLS